MTREAEFADRIQRLQDEFADLPAPVRAQYMMVGALGVVDGFCFSHTKRRANVDEFVTVARGAYSKARELVPLLKPTPPGEN